MSQPSVNVNNVDYGRGLKAFGDKKNYLEICLPFEKDAYLYTL